MAAADTVAALTGFAGRGGGTDAERRAAAWLAAEIPGPRRTAGIETFWSRPEWALAHAWHVALALAGSLVSIGAPRVGAALVLAAIAAVVLDAATGVSPGRRLTRERASQNVVAPAPEPDRPVRLIVTANYDAGRTGLVHRTALRRAAATLRAATAGRGPGWRAWLLLDCAGLVAVAVVRNAGHPGRAVAIVQLFLTVALIVGLALLLELAAAPWGPAAGDDASGVAVALALVRALDVAPPRHLGVELVLTGAGDGSGAALAHHLATHRPAPGTDTVVLGLAACGDGDPRWWTGDGSLVPLRFSPRLTALAARAGPPLLLELAAAPWGPAAGDDASGVAVALALVRALDVAPPRHLGIELVLTGAGDGSGAALAHHLATHRPAPGTDTVVLGLAACGDGDPRWWTGDGSLVPLRFSPRLTALAARAGEELAAAPHRGRGSSPAVPARRARIPAITLGALDPHGLSPRSHLPDDTPDAIDRGAMDRVLALALGFVDYLDAAIATDLATAKVS